MGVTTVPRKGSAWFLMTGLTSFLLIGCATAPPQQSSDRLPAETAIAQSVPEGDQSISTPPNYILRPGDQISVRFHYHPGYNQELTVQPDGEVVLPGLGGLPAAGQKPTELAHLIAQGYSDVLRNPEVDVQVKLSTGQRIYVGGEVMKPGFVNLNSGLTTLQAIVEAGGFRETAKLSNIVIVRGGYKPEGGKPEGFLVDLQQVVEGHDFSKDVTLQPYDIVFVPKSAIAKANQFIENYLVRMLPVRPGVGLGF